MAPILLSAALITGCVREAPLPDAGACALTPEEGTYAWGEIGIGTCLAGPSDLQIWGDPHDPERYHVAVVNSNFEANFSSGSLVLIPGDGIDLSRPTNYMHEVGASSIDLPTFPARVALDADRRAAFVSVRSAAGIDGNLTDRVFAIDAADPAALGWSAAAPEQDERGAYVFVPPDPWSVVFQPETGLLFTLNLTTHDVAVIDTLKDPYTVVDASGAADLSEVAFVDADASGSVSDFEVGAFQEEVAPTDSWTVAFNEGTYRLYFAARDEDGGDGIVHADSPDGAAWFDSQGGADLPFPGEDEGWDGAGYASSSTMLWFDAEGNPGLLMWVEGIDPGTGTATIGLATADSTGTSWSAAEQVLVAGSPGRFDEAGVGDPSVIGAGEVFEMFYEGRSADGSTAIGRASSADGQTFGRIDSGDSETGRVLRAGEGGAWDDSGVGSPSVLWLSELDRYFLYYDSPDSPVGGIGLARSQDGAAFDRVDTGSGPGRVVEPGEAGAWDSAWIGAPTVIRDNGRFHLWYAGTDGVTWAVGHATSYDGLRWVKDPANPVYVGPDEGFRKVEAGAYKASPGGYWSVEGELTGFLPETALANVGYAYALSPVLFTLVDGHALGWGADDEFDRGGVASPGARIAEDGTVELLYEGRGGGVHRLGLATSADGLAYSRAGSLEFDTASLTGEVGEVEDFDDPAFGGALSDDRVLFAGAAGERVRIYSATRDGGTWSAASTPLLAESGVSGTFDSATVGAPSLAPGPDGDWLLFYEGSDGDRYGIGLAVSGDGLAFERASDGTGHPDDAGLVLDRGEPGDWDDAGVRGPTVSWDGEAGLYRMWYAGSDGQVWRIGMATSEDGRAWTRHADDEGRPVAVLEPRLDVPAFDEDGVFDPDVVWDEDRGVWRMWYQGFRDDVPRIGYAESEDGVHWLRMASRPTAGDRFEFDTLRGDDSDTTTIFLGDERTGIIVDGETVRGSGVSEMVLSPDGRYLYVANKKFDNVYVVDVHDDSTAEQLDANYLGVEAVIRTRLDEQVVGTRGLAFSADGETLYALLSPLVVAEEVAGNTRGNGPEAVLLLDAGKVVESPEPYTIDDAVLGWLPSVQGVEEDAGSRTAVSVGPANIEISADGRLAYVAQFNANLVQVYDLTKGAYGMPVDEVRGLGEEPFDLALSPDGKLLFVANYTGELGGDQANVTHSTLSVIDTDPESPTYHTVLTTLRNRDAN